MNNKKSGESTNSVPSSMFASASPRVSFNFIRSSVKTTFAFIKKINTNVVEETDKVVEEEVETIIFHQIETKFIR